ncbi:sensor histidine kinase [Pseudoxanthomonas sp. SL93]|jgi:signal transduction histidine kinase|uniref:sensor histidine kinase n=1 Tax=Pseudoxanthomonas sp. SL93 TaxID=2995142 RepID=UPI002270BB5C|nr:sensor histidine kinase [Pseudoxanthomonas sp. SL93]WAC64588.1 sensor histidine kinase [Pseudoxanthomonas sp. SL93]
MLGRLSHTRLLRAAGLYTWALVGIPIILNVWVLPPSSATDGRGVNLPLTALCYFSFGAGYWLATRALDGRKSGLPLAWNVPLAMVLTAAAIGVGAYTETGLGAVLLLIMAGVLPWLLELRFAVAWLLAAHVLLVPSFMARDDFNFWEALFQSMFYVGFSAFVLITTFVARQQAQAREDQRRLNAELRATRVLLAESARVNERTRISRELHDLLGHHLTALSLNLEVAGHMTEGRAQDHVKQAHTLARLLLTDVREAVSQLRDSGAIDLGAALYPLAEKVPSLSIHMDIEEPLTLEDPHRAHVLLRCTQEIITNAVRHAGARNLWVHCRRDGYRILIDARDDGNGADQVVSGNGLTGMRERLAQYGGDLVIETRPGKGFCLHIALPVNDAGNGLTATPNPLSEPTPELSSGGNP